MSGHRLLWTGDRPERPACAAGALRLPAWPGSVTAAPRAARTAAAVTRTEGHTA